MPKHSPHPWIPSFVLDGRGRIVQAFVLAAGRMHTVCTMPCRDDNLDHRGNEAILADLVLLGAAPELLESCRDAAWLLEYVPDPAGTIKPLERQAEAIAAKTKATTLPTLTPESPAEGG